MTLVDTPNTASIIFKTFPVGPLQCNCSIVGDPISRKAVLIDPGGDAEVILETLQSLDLELACVVHTHAHFDHFLASGHIHQATHAPLALNRDDYPLWQWLDRQCAMFGVPYEPVPDPHHWLEDGEPITLGQQVSGQCIHTPGHTPGSTCFWFADYQLLVAGDTLFRRSVGRTDLWGGDFQAIERSIREKLYTLDESTTVITGHGPATSIGDEIRHNAIVRGG